MSLTQLETETLAVLRLQYQDLGAEANAIKASRNAVLSLGSTLLVGGFFFGIHEENHWLVAAIPGLFAGVLLHSLQLLANSRAQGAYRHYVEQRINAILGHRTAFWEETANGAMTKTAVLTALFFAGLYFTITLSAILQSVQHLPAWFAVLEVVGMLGMTVLLLVAMRSAQGAYHQTLQRAAPSLEGASFKDRPPMEVVVGR
jgi:hypothetical protein